MADVKITMDADVAQAIRANEQLAASEAKVEQAAARKATAVESANRRIEQSTRQTAQAVEQYELAPTGSSSDPAIRFGGSSARLTRPRSFALAPIPTGAAGGLSIAPAAAGYELASEVRMRELEYRADSNRSSQIYSASMAALSQRKAATDHLQQVRDQNKLEAFAEQQAASAQRMETVKSKVIDGAMALTVAIIAVGDRIASAMEQARGSIDAFYKSGRGAMSLPAWVKSSSSFKRTALGLSTEYGADLNQTVAPLLEQIAIQGPQLSGAERMQMAGSALRFGQMTGGSAGGFASVVDNIRDVYPQLSVAQAGNLVTFLRNEGGLTVENQEQVLGTLLPQMSRLGIPVEQLGALASMTSQMGGPEGTMAKGARTALGKIEGLKKKGLIKGGGDLIDIFGQLDALSQRRPDLISDAFSELGAGAAPMIHAIANNRSEFQHAWARASSAVGSADLNEEAFQQKYRRDPEFRMAIDSERENQRKANAPLLSGLEEQERQLKLQRREAITAESLTVRDGDSTRRYLRNKFLTGIGAGYWIPRSETLFNLNLDAYNAAYQAPESARGAIDRPGASPASAPAAQTGDKLNDAAEKLNRVADHMLQRIDGSRMRPPATQNVGIINFNSTH
jgi:hypothetical protein